jgi:hypothetical protein
MYVFETKEAVEVSDVILDVEVIETTEVFRTLRLLKLII